MTATATSAGIWRSLLAIFAGIVAGIVLSLGTDFLLRAAGVFPPLGVRMGSGLLLLATVYRTVYAVVGSYVTARLAPSRPMTHVMVLGGMGLAANAFGTIATWNQGPAFGPHWYPVALILLALPTAWAGGKLWIAQRDRAREQQPLRSA